MKHDNIILFGWMLFSAVNIANAETVASFVTEDDLSAIGISSSSTFIEGGTTLIDNAAGTLALAYDDDWKGGQTLYSYGTYQTVTVGGGEEITLDSGVAGSTNPIFTSYQDGVMSAGAVFEYTAKKDGWVTIFTRINPEKQYIVFEDRINAVPYTLGIAGNGFKLWYSLPTASTGDNAGYIDFDSSDVDKYFRPAEKQMQDESGIPLWYDENGNIVASEERPILTDEEGSEYNASPVKEVIDPQEYVPEFPYNVAGPENSVATGTGFIMFKVHSGCTYQFSALGSKMSCGGFVYSSGALAPEVRFLATDTLPEVIFDGEQTTGPPAFESGKPYIAMASYSELQKAGFSSDTAEIQGGTVILDNEVGTFEIPFTDNWRTDEFYGIRDQDTSHYPIRVGNSDVFTIGVSPVGLTNPVFTSYEDGVMTGGAVYKIQAKKTGWITVFNILFNPDKRYVVIENNDGAVPYTLGGAGNGYKINYCLPFHTSGDNAGYINFNTVHSSKYFEELTPGKHSPQYPHVTADLESELGNGMGFLTFKVTEGNSYYVSGIGTRMPCQGFVFTDSEAEPAVTLLANGELPEVNFGTRDTLPNDPESLAAGEDFEYQGIIYTVIDADTRTCETKAGSWTAGNTVAGDITIPSKVFYESNDYTVVGIGNASFGGNSSLTSMNIPETVTYMGIGAFTDCNSLTTINIPDGITRIEESLFSNCGSLTSIQIPLSVTYIGRLAFQRCSNLTYIQIPESVTYIDSKAFAYCSGLTSITLPAGISTIEKQAFLPCDKIGLITYNSNKPITSTSDIFSSSIYETTTLEMPNATLADIQATVPWNMFKRIVASDGSIGFMPGVGETVEYRGISYTILTENEAEQTGTVTTKPGESFGMPGNSISGDVEIPGGFEVNDVYYDVTQIGDYGFSGADLLTSITLPKSIEKIGMEAFSGCKQLTSLVWQAHTPLEDEVINSIANPNLLVYVDYKDFAPSSLDSNVVVMLNNSQHFECSNLVLTPKYPFKPLWPFDAAHCSLTKSFTQHTPIDGCAGWETIVVPFDVTEITAYDGRNLTPFAAMENINTQYPFWLYEANSNGLGWVASPQIKAGMPYIISMPNNEEYSEEYRISGNVTFSSNQTFRISPESEATDVVTWTSGRQFRSLWLPLSDEEAAQAMGLNVGIDNLVGNNGEVLAPGSAFHVGVVPQPLEAYVTRIDGQRAMKIGGGQSNVLLIDADRNLDIRSSIGSITVTSAIDRVLDICTTDGIKIRSLNMKAGDTITVSDLTKGIYIIANRKITVK